MTQPTYRHADEAVVASHADPQVVRRSMTDHYMVQSAQGWLAREVNPYDPADVAVYVGTGRSLMRHLVATLDRRDMR